LAYVWVLTNLSEVVYILAESREGEIVQELLRGFHGVLVSDFYAAYDTIRCPQQKCLIHLMRDLNDEILNNPFDGEMKSVAVGFASLLKPMVDTIDRRGLRKSSLRKHLVAVDQFYNVLDTSDFKSEAALKCQQRFLKNRDKLFTFLRYDGVPWNNNNAEHAIKAFSRLRDVMAGSSSKKGVNEYLTLLTVAETCEYQGSISSSSFDPRRKISIRSRGAVADIPGKKEVEICLSDQGKDRPPPGTIFPHRMNLSACTTMPPDCPHRTGARLIKRVGRKKMHPFASSRDGDVMGAASGPVAMIIGRGKRGMRLCR